jgi:hypothetical protein
MNIPKDLRPLSDKQLKDLEHDLVAAFRRLNADLTPKILKRQRRLVIDLDLIRAEQAGRAERLRVTARQWHARQASEQSAQSLQAKLSARVHPGEAPMQDPPPRFNGRW